MVPTGRGCDGKQIYWIPVDQMAKAIALISTDHKGDCSVDTVLFACTCMYQLSQGRVALVPFVGTGHSTDA